MHSALDLVLDATGASRPGGHTNVKVLDACVFNRDRVFARSLTDVNVVMTVTDTQMGAAGSQSLVVDLVLGCSTYLGGGSADSGYAIAPDGSNKVSITGTTQSVNFPVKPGSFQNNFGGRRSTRDTRDRVRPDHLQKEGER